MTRFLLSSCQQKQGTADMGSDGPGLSCPGSNVVAEDESRKWWIVASSTDMMGGLIMRLPWRSVAYQEWMRQKDEETAG